MVKVTKYSICVIFILDNTLHGYAFDVTNVNLAKNEKTEYFTFELQTQEDNHDCVCYSPEKHQLFKNISQERAQNIGAETKRYRGDKNLTVNDYSSVKKRNLDFEERKVELCYLNISTIMNERPLYDILHVHGLLFNKSEEKSKLKDGKMLRIVEAKIKD